MGIIIYSYVDYIDLWIYLYVLIVTVDKYIDMHRAAKYMAALCYLFIWSSN
jgi:hypothetical protein